MSNSVFSSSTIYTVQLNEDIDGEIQFLSQTGPFSLPVKCLTKKCLVSLEKSHYDFGSVYLGETLRQRIIVYNAGALTANYTISAVVDTSEQATPLPPTQPVEVMQTLTAGDQSKEKLSERSAYSIMSNVEIFRDRAGSSSGLGVIPADSAGNRLKSKSVGVLSFQTVPEGEEHDEEEGGATPQGKSSDKKSQKVSPRPESRSAPGGGTRSAVSGGRVDTPSISLHETAASGSQTPQPEERPRESPSPHTLPNTSPHTLPDTLPDASTGSGWSNCLVFIHFCLSC